MNNLEDLIHKHFILNNSDIFRPLFNKYCNLIYEKEYNYNANNVSNMLHGVFNNIYIQGNIYYLQNKTDIIYVCYISFDHIGFINSLIEYLELQINGKGNNI